ncbi:MAG: 23S rRNA (guanosine(2251)-2'-O)-methyltransferase RlmB [Candidatus Promineifilaceae bacterium]
MSSNHEFIYRRNAVREGLRSRGRKIFKFWIQKGLPKKEAAPFLQMARQRKIRIQETDKQTLGNLAKDRGHQGVVLEVSPFRYAEVDDMLALADERKEPPLLLVLDLVQGPQNVGMLVRSAEAVGVHGIIMQDRRAPDITPAMVIASAGATEHLPIAKVTNLNQTLNRLKDAGVWIVGTAMDKTAQTLGEVDLNRPIALVIGHEGSGLRQQVRHNCDLLITLPMKGHVESLNAAVSGSILLYAAWQARGFA